VLSVEQVIPHPGLHALVVGRVVAQAQCPPSGGGACTFTADLVPPRVGAFTEPDRDVAMRLRRNGHDISCRGSAPTRCGELEVGEVYVVAGTVSEPVNGQPVLVVSDDPPPYPTVTSNRSP